MTFTPDIPRSGQTLGNSRTEVLGNFANFNTVVSVNHVAPNAVGQGKHKFVEMPVQSPSPSTLAAEGGLFTKTTSGSSELFYQRDAVATDYQMTGPVTINTGVPRNFKTMVLGGLVVQGGYIPSGSSTTVTFPSTFANRIFFFDLSKPTGSATASSITTSGFTASNTTTDAYYLVIGN